MIYVVLGVLGLIFGSFINAYTWRIHEQEESRGKELRAKSKKQKELDLSILHGRSMCVDCKHELAPKDLIPLLSWLSLGGKCRYCKAPISWQYPAVEAVTSLLFVLSYSIWPYAWSGRMISLFIVWLATLIVLISLFVYDLRWMLLPNRIVVWLWGLVGVQVLLQCIFFGGFQPLATAFWGLLALGGLFYALFQISGGRWIGGGDVKLGFGLGVLVGGPLPAFMVLFLASVLGTVVSIPLMASSRLKVTSRIPFGPFLIAAAIVVYLFGKVWVAWTVGHLLVF